MNQAHLLELILSQHISEKATVIGGMNQYVFKVKNANKQAIKDAVEFLFNTKVKSVRIVNVKPKIKMFRGIKGTRKKWKKAYVTLHSDQKLDITRVQ
jgi:large subunit ribosomal protein L23